MTTAPVSSVPQSVMLAARSLISTILLQLFNFNHADLTEKLNVQVRANRRRNCVWTSLAVVERHPLLQALAEELALDRSGPWSKTSILAILFHFLRVNTARLHLLLGCTMPVSNLDTRFLLLHELRMLLFPPRQPRHYSAEASERSLLFIDVSLTG